MVSTTTTTTTKCQYHRIFSMLLQVCIASTIIQQHDGTANAASAFLDHSVPASPSSSSSSPLVGSGRIKNKNLIRPSPIHQQLLLPRTNQPKSSSSQLLMAAGDVATFAVLSDVDKLYDYAPAATSLFNNMKLPAAVVTAGMISLGFATSFPELPPGDENYSAELRQFCETLRRVHIVVALISVTSELIAVLWAAVEVNQLTERVFEPTSSVWELIQRDCDLAWSAVNSHFTMGIIGFVAMLSLRAYVMLIAARASKALMSAALCGTTAALCLMISIVNRGVQAGGGNGVGYGATIIDLLQHYAMLLYQAAINSGGGGDPAATGPGPLQFAAIALEVASIGFVIQILLTPNGDKEQPIPPQVQGEEIQHVRESQPQTLTGEEILPQQPNQPLPPTKNRVDTDTIFPKKKKNLFFANKNNNDDNNPLSLIPPPGILESQNLIASSSTNRNSNSNSSPYAAVPSSSSSSSSSSTTTTTTSTSSASASSAPSSSSGAAATSSQQQPLNGDSGTTEGTGSTAGGGTTSIASATSSSSTADDIGGGGGGASADDFGGGAAAGMG